MEDLIDKDEKIVRLSEVTLDEEKKILSAKGPLRKYVKQIVKKKIRLCYVMIEKELFGQKKEDIDRNPDRRKEIDVRSSKRGFFF